MKTFYFILFYRVIFLRKYKNMKSNLQMKEGSHVLFSLTKQKLRQT